MYDGFCEILSAGAEQYGRRTGIALSLFRETGKTCCKGNDRPVSSGSGGKAAGAIETAIKAVEDFPYYKSVGYGGLPNEDQVVELDAGYMDGDTFDVGAICAIKDFANPISIAKKLSEEKVNNILVSYGAEKYAREHHFEEKEMLTDRAKAFYRKKKKELEQQAQELKPYDGHDTVGMVCLDENGTVVAGTSTSGLFMKKPGRIGDSPFVGSGFYADSEVGGATATGLGEDLMKGCISYEIVRLRRDEIEKWIIRFQDVLS